MSQSMRSAFGNQMNATMLAKSPQSSRQIFGLAILAILALTFPLLDGNEGNIDSFANAFAYAALALGLNIVVGFVGLLDLGYAAYFAIGAYAYGALASFQIMPAWSDFWEPFAWLHLVERTTGNSGDVVHFTVSFWIMLPLSGFLAALFGVIFCAPTLRLRGDYLAVVTMGFGLVVPIIARNWEYLTNGAAGLNAIAAPSIGSFSFGVAAMPYYYLGLAIVCVLIFISLRLQNSRIGRAWFAIREDEIASSAMGIDNVKFKILAFAIGAAFAGVAGAFYAAKVQTAIPEMFGFPVSAMILTMIVFGGLGNVWGVVLGAIILQLLQSWWLNGLTSILNNLGTTIGSDFLARVDLSQTTELAFGVILVLTMLYRREGLLPARRQQAALSFEQQHAEVQVDDEKTRSVIRTIVKNDPVDPASALTIENVTVRFGGLVALNSVSINVPRGSVVAVIGPNGSGKSTLFNVITGLITGQGGSVLFQGKEVLGLRPHEILKMGIARTFQNIRLFSSLTVLDNVLIGQHARLRTGPLSAILKLPKTSAEESEAIDKVRNIVSIFGNRLAPRLTQTVAHLSYANRRRVEISRALASQPKILLLDEPTAGMNPSESLELARQIKMLHEAGLTIVLIEHKLDVVTKLADRVYVLDHGVVIAEGTPDQVRHNEEVITAYLGRNTQAGSAASVA